MLTAVLLKGEMCLICSPTALPGSVQEHACECELCLHDFGGILSLPASVNCWSGDWLS